jgi:tRNA-binding EMAP/Myf-like protein
MVMHDDHVQHGCVVPRLVSGVVVGRIIQASRHPHADRLWVVTVDVGDHHARRLSRKLTVVHGGTRPLHPGQLVPVAPPGAVVQRPDGTRRRMRTRRYRGQRSQGMLCSTNELGWTQDGPDAVHVLSEGQPGCPLRTGGTAMARATYLSPPDLHRLDWACRPIADAFGEPVYLVGSTLDHPDFRDIDLRLIVDDDTADRLFGTDTFGLHGDGNGAAVRLLLNIALSDLITKAASPPRPVDFQIQSMTEANVPDHGRRHPLGLHIDRSSPLATASV